MPPVRRRGGPTWLLLESRDRWSVSTLAGHKIAHAVKSPGRDRNLPDSVGTVLVVLAGRDSERAAIAALLDDARTGRGGALVVHGVAGSGKSTLLADALGNSTGMRLLRTSGVESESPLAFAA